MGGCFGWVGVVGVGGVGCWWHFGDALCGDGLRRESGNGVV